jgi:hypothetical protein
MLKLIFNKNLYIISYKARTALSTHVIILFIFIIIVSAFIKPSGFAAAAPFETAAPLSNAGNDIGVAAENGELIRAIKFSRLVGMVYDKKNAAGVKGCEISIGREKTITNANGYFEITSILAGEYIITASVMPYERHIDVITIKAPICAVKIYLSPPGYKISETKKANTEYDRLLAKIMKGSVNQIDINGDPPARKKTSYSSGYGRKQMIEEDTKGGRAYSKKTSGEVSKAPKISTGKGFGLLVCSVFESSGAEIESNARVIIATQSIETQKSQPVEIHNVPAGSYKITVKCEGYKDRVYDKIIVKAGKNERSFFIEKAR